MVSGDLTVSATNNMFSTTDQMTGPPLWTLCPPCLISPRPPLSATLRCLICPTPLSDDRRLAQMTRLHLLSNHLPPLTRIVNLGRACQCLARGRILRGPQGSLVHTSPPSAPFVFGSLQRGSSEVPPCPQLPICCCHQCSLLLLSPQIWWENWTPSMARYWPRWLD